MSVILLGAMDSEFFLLTGDAGIEGLNNAMDCIDENNLNLQAVSFYQVPHHGGRHNVSPSVLNRLIGHKVVEGTISTKTAFVSVAKGSDHPKKMVVNGFIRRGIKVYKTNGAILYHSKGTPNRGWGAAQELNFCKEVESWDE
jgi:beta-lactamase superfamily II metal-dependent hydrolase